VNLDGETVFPVSEMLDAIGVPYIFITSRPASSLPVRYQGRPLLAKPYNSTALLALVKQVLGKRPTDSALPVGSAVSSASG
jgi:hypothetical protein